MADVRFPNKNVWGRMKNSSVRPKSKMKMPKKDIPVRINDKTVVYTDSVDKIAGILERYKDK